MSTPMDSQTQRDLFATPIEQRQCRWCGRGNDWSKRWEWVNGRRWYHEECINLMDMVS